MIDLSLRFISKRTVCAPERSYCDKSALSTKGRRGAGALKRRNFLFHRIRSPFCASQILRLQSCIFRNLFQRDRAKLHAIMPRPGEARESFSLQLNMGTLLFSSRPPSNAQQCPVDAARLTARPRAHKNRMDFGDFRICSVRSAITRSASAVTLTSASCSVAP